MVELYHPPIAANLTILRGKCIEPFLDVKQFTNGGRKKTSFERFWALLNIRLQMWTVGCVRKSIYCRANPHAAYHVLLPTGFIRRVCRLHLVLCFSFVNSYTGFETWYRISESMSAVGLVICTFLLLSWAFLPVEKTRRHYLSICLVIGIVLEAVSAHTCFLANKSAYSPQLAFVVPLGVKPKQCFDEITPNNMHTSLTCAFSGAFIVLGALVVTVWSRHPNLSFWAFVPC